MKNILLLGTLAAGLAQSAAAATIPLWENRGVVQVSTNAPGIDALAFANYGFFSVFSPIPYDFQNVLNFTNRGQMFGSVGFQFDTAPAKGVRKPAQTFVNAPGAAISADGFANVIIIPGSTINIIPSYITVIADKVSNQGLLSASSAGRISLQGQDMNLSRGGIEIRRVEGSGPSISPTNFLPDAGIRDTYWAITNDFDIPLAGILTMTPTATNVTTPVHLVTNAFGAVFGQIINLVNPFSSVNLVTNSATNLIVQAAFVGLPNDPSMFTDIRWTPSAIRTNPFYTASVEISRLESNVVTGSLDVNTLYLTDRLASDTNYVVLTNLAVIPETFIPATYTLSRVPTLEFFDGGAGNGVLTNTLFFDSSLSNSLVTNVYAAYGAQVSPDLIQLPQVQGLSITQQPGRVEIDAGNLNLERARIRGNTFVTIRTDNLTGSSNAVVSVRNLSFNLAAQNQPLLVQDLAKETVEVFAGSIRAYSAFWTNYSGMIVTNEVPDPNDPTVTTNVVETNIIEIGYHYLVVDATQLESTAPVLTHDFNLRGPSIVVEDSLTVNEKMVLDTERFTLRGQLSLVEHLADFNITNAPGVRWFTNEGTLNIEDTGTFGNDRSFPYESFVNKGTLQAAGAQFWANSFENAGVLQIVPGNLFIDAASVKLQNGSGLVQGDVRIVANDLKFQNHTNQTLGAYIIDVSDRIGDAGDEASSLWICENGFILARKPFVGDLLGTAVESAAGKYLQIENSWAAENRGASVNGFVNNVALGRLSLNGDFDSSHRFSGPGFNNALYVDRLELEGFILEAFERGDIASGIQVDPGFTIYFADANVDPALLQQQSGGRMVWVPEFIGPNSGVDVIRRDNSTARMNRAVRESASIDSDNDGIVNVHDFYPLDADPLEIVLTDAGLLGPAKAVAFSWEARPGVTYIVEYSTDLASGEWTFLKTYTNSGASVKVATVEDSPFGQAQRYYRVRLNP